MDLEYYEEATVRQVSLMVTADGHINLTRSWRLAFAECAGLTATLKQYLIAFLPSIQ
jgi:hypothetical protein